MPSRPVRVVGIGRSDRGSVTAETVMVLPLLVAITLGLAWLLSLAATQVRVVDAAREVARAVARDEGRSSALALGRRVAPDGSRIEVRGTEDTVVVRVRAQVRGALGLFAFLPAVDVHADAVAAKEPT
jgi:Flp pilus assembly protein TadG